MANVDGITGAAPIWHDYMEMALDGTPVEQFTLPAGVVTDRVCTFDGGLASPGDSSAIEEVFLASARPTKPCAYKPVATPSPSATPEAAPAEQTPPPKDDGAPVSPSASPTSTPLTKP